MPWFILKLFINEHKILIVIWTCSQIFQKCSSSSKVVERTQYVMDRQRNQKTIYLSQCSGDRHTNGQFHGNSTSLYCLQNRRQIKYKSHQMWNWKHPYLNFTTATHIKKNQLFQQNVWKNKFIVNPKWEKSPVSNQAIIKG